MKLVKLGTIVNEQTYYNLWVWIVLTLSNDRCLYMLVLYWTISTNAKNTLFSPAQNYQSKVKVNLHVNLKSGVKLPNTNLWV